MTIFLYSKIKIEIQVPPRHPLQRLTKLGVFYDNFFAEMAAIGTMKQGEAERRAVSVPSNSDSLDHK